MTPDEQVAKREELLIEVRALDQFQDETNAKIKELRGVAKKNTARLLELYAELAKIPVEPAVEYVPEVVVTMKPRHEWPEGGARWHGPHAK